MACRLHPVPYAEPRFEGRLATPPFVSRLLPLELARHDWRRFSFYGVDADEHAGKAGSGGGHGMVGQRFLGQLVEAAPGRFEITVLGEEPRAAYDRVQLTSFFSGKTADDLSVTPIGFMQRHGIELRLNERVVSIDRDAKVVRTSLGAELPYDTLVLATGSYPFVPPVPGRDRPGCFVYRTIEDLEAISAEAQSSKTEVVIGGGLLGPRSREGARRSRPADARRSSSRRA